MFLMGAVILGGKTLSLYYQEISIISAGTMEYLSWH